MIILLCACNTGSVNTTDEGENRLVDVEYLWITGTWIEYDTADNKVRYEVWEPRDSGFIGAGFTLINNDTNDMESLALVKHEGVVNYVADVAHNPLPVYFKLSHQTDSGFRFENLEHDFPKYIDYNLVQDTLHVRVGNEMEELIFNFIKLKNDE